MHYILDIKPQVKHEKYHFVIFIFFVISLIQRFAKIPRNVNDCVITRTNRRVGSLVINHPPDDWVINLRLIHYLGM